MQLLIDVRHLPLPVPDDDGAGGFLHALLAAAATRDCGLRLWLGSRPAGELDGARRAWEAILPHTRLHAIDREGLPADAGDLLEAGALAALAPDCLLTLERAGSAAPPASVPPGLRHWVVRLDGGAPTAGGETRADSIARRRLQSLKCAQAVWLAAGAPAPPVALAADQARRFAADDARLQADELLAALAATPPADAPVLRSPERPRLAFLSPLPPARSGIADYAAELLPELAVHYDITLVSDEPVGDPWLAANFPLVSVARFRATAARYERVVYQLGNSEFHAHMVPLLADIPGVVVLHDFYLGHLHAAREYLGGQGGALAEALYRSHGWPGLRALARDGLDEALLRYPANAGVLAGATGVIVHSAHARALGEEWLGTERAGAWKVLPHLRRMPAAMPDAAAVRRGLGVAPDALLVCSFGFLTPSKCNTALLAAWKASGLAARKDCQLVLVGRNADDAYGAAVTRALRDIPNARITGFAEPEAYRQWLSVADVAVQLRQQTRGESSGTVLDCLAHGLPLIVNAHGAMAELPEDAVHRLPDAFTGDALAAALLALCDDAGERRRLSARAREHVARYHDPLAIAGAYADAIERATRQSPLAVLYATGRRIAALPQPPAGAAADACARELALQYPATPCWYVDITALRDAAHVTGIERVTEALLFQLLASPPAGVRTIPVYADPVHGYREDRRYLAQTLDLPGHAREPLILPRAGDLFLGLDWVPGAVLGQREMLAAWRRRGVRLWFLVHDILPATNPEWFPGHVPPVFRAWLAALGELAHGCVCVSAATAASLGKWWQGQGLARPPRLAVSHNGADLGAAAPAVPTAPEPLSLPQPCVLMVGTIEPRKGYRQALAAFEQLWAEGVAVHLVIVGREGWRQDSAADRAPVSELARLLREHPQQGQQLHWFDDLDDSDLVSCYRGARLLLAASEDEGFGLPLVEAAYFGTPRVLRDIPVFREMAGAQASYFSAPPATDPQARGLVKVLRTVLAAPEAERRSDSPLTWERSGLQLRRLLLADACPEQSMKQGMERAPAHVNGGDFDDSGEPATGLAP